MAKVTDATEFALGGVGHIHVLPHSQGWAVKRNGTARNYRIVSTRSAAEKVANRLAKSQGVNIYLHDNKGRILDVVTSFNRYGT